MDRFTASVRVPLGGGDALGADVDARVVNDGVHTTDRVDLVGDLTRFRGTPEITDDHPGCAGRGIPQADGP